MVDMLKLKPTEKLAFVYQIVYNTNRVDFFVKVGEEGSVTAAFKNFFKLNVSVSVDLLKYGSSEPGRIHLSGPDY